jgi:hypothetical protein
MEFEPFCAQESNHSAAGLAPRYAAWSAAELNDPGNPALSRSAFSGVRLANGAGALPQFA